MTKTKTQITIDSIRKTQKRIDLKIRNKEYKDIIEPAIKRSGLPTQRYIKQAIYEKIARDEVCAEEESNK